MTSKSKLRYYLKFWSSLCLIPGLFSATLSLRLPIFSSPNPDISLFVSPNSSDFTESFDLESFRFGSIFREHNLTRAIRFDSEWYRTTIVMILGSLDEAVGSLMKVSLYIKTLVHKSTTKHSKMKLLLIMPEERDLFNQSKHSATEIIRRKLDIEDLRLMFDLRKTLLLAFYTVKHKTPEESSSFNIWEFYAIKNKSFARHIAENVSETQLSLLLESGTQVSRRQDWSGVDIVAAAFIVSGNFGEDDKGDEHVEIHGVTKYELNVMKNKRTRELILKPSLSARIFWDIEWALNFTAKILRPFKYSDGFDNVILKHGHEFDIIISHFTLVPQKLKHAQNLAITYFNSISAFFIQPPVHSFRNIYTTPFTMGMWAMIILTYASIGLSLHAIRWVRSCSTNANEVDAQELEIDEQVTNDWVWWAIAAACQQGWYTSPKTTPSRVVFCTGLLFSLVCYAAYTATIVSELWDTVVPIRSLEALMTNSKYIYVESQSDIAEIVVEGLTQRNTDLLSKVRVINLTQASLSYMDSSTPGCFLNWPEYFIDDAKDMIEKTNLSSNIEVQFCEKISSFSYKYIPVKASMFVQKGSPFTEIFNYRILISAERGLLNRHWKEYIHNTEIKCLLNTNTTYALGIYDTWAVFTVLIAGYVASLVILALELVTSGVHLRST